MGSTRVIRPATHHPRPIGSSDLPPRLHPYPKVHRQPLHHFHGANLACWDDCRHHHGTREPGSRCVWGTHPRAPLPHDLRHRIPHATRRCYAHRQIPAPAFDPDDAPPGGPVLEPTVSMDKPRTRRFLRRRSFRGSRQVPPTRNLQLHHWSRPILHHHHGVPDECIFRKALLSNLDHTRHRFFHASRRTGFDQPQSIAQPPYCRGGRTLWCAQGRRSSSSLWTSRYDFPRRILRRIAV
ncbi:MAG: hypothetical protein BWY82_02272 [Verrucomicrobia bacterium ADurb.Bin474]|nr:MAG: hypothetical protein BWY82_02272 [Verrucomicrobia bacterium ADurb.Bin474]